MMANIIEFFRDKHIFVTGGTGFMGKVLLEKLLRSCSDVGNIYVLIRPKKEKDPRERIKDITDLPVTSYQYTL
jgi:fatty acyl-CoA reductase